MQLENAIYRVVHKRKNIKGVVRGAPTIFKNK